MTPASGEPDLGESDPYEGDLVIDDDDEPAGIFDVMETWVETAGDIATTGIESVAGVFTGAQDSVVEVATGAQDSVVEVISGGQEVISGAVDKVANPWNLLGLGGGLAAGGVLATAAIAIGGAVVVDELLFAGAGRMMLVRGVSSRRKGR